MVDKTYKFMQSADSADTTELLIHGDIIAASFWGNLESDVGSFDIAKELENVTTPNLLVRINSNGGDASQGLGIYNLLKSFKGKVITINDGFACSAASVIFMAGVERIMPKSSLLLIHNAWTIAQGDSNDFKKTASDLETITKPIIETYLAVSNLSEAQIKKMMDAETWITADEAVAWGFATKVQENTPKQSLEDHFLYKLVMKNKEYEKLLDVATKPQPKSETKDSWKSFFKGTKGN